MSNKTITKQERDAYHRGQQEREAQSNPLWYILTPSKHMGYTEAEKKAFIKGLRGEKLSKD